MPLSRSLFQEGIIIPPIRLVDRGTRNEAVFSLIVRNSRTQDERRGDLAAQCACHTIAHERLLVLLGRIGVEQFVAQTNALIAYSRRQMELLLAQIPPGRYTAVEYLDDDGISPQHIAIQVALTIDATHILVDFTGTAQQCAGPLNAPRAVTESAVLYALRLIAPDDVPMTAGTSEPISFVIPVGSILNPLPPAAVAGGNVETSQRAACIKYRYPRPSASTVSRYHEQLDDGRLACGWVTVRLLRDPGRWDGCAPYCRWIERRANTHDQYPKLPSGGIRTVVSCSGPRTFDTPRFWRGW